MTFLLDTNVCIAVLRGHPGVQSRLRQKLPSACGISSITGFELLAGAERSRSPGDERQRVERFARPMATLAFDADAADCAARIRRALESRGEKIGPYDLLLAGHALSLGLTLVTSNVREFARVEGLAVEDWQADG
ncbi:MAG: PIN domain-containing protein [Verrucomicrobia bacterium]|nr:PIN domain-containing protein [Verrucomicrobiota bacterium]